MNLGSILAPENVRLGISATGLSEALLLLLRGLGPATGLDTDRLEALADEVAQGRSGVRARANEDVLLAVVESSDAPEAIATLGVFRHGFETEASDEGTARRARVLLVLVTPRRAQLVRAEAIPRLARAFRSGSTTDILLSAGSPEQVLGLDDLMQTELRGTLLVSDAMSPISFRVYPDTPMGEVVDLMVRRGVTAVPVVGSSYEVLGVLSRADTLDRLLSVSSGEDGDITGALEDVHARDVMSRSVFCVDEDQTLMEAARSMVSKGFEQLPVVRQGELVGLIHQEAVLRMLSGH